MKKFKKALRIIVAVVVISGAVFAVASTTTPTVTFGCEGDCN
ncbi:MAG: hypothetical protein ABI792_09450 [bacterium]